MGRYAAVRAPRYTSYPTAVAFTTAVGPGDRARWLERLAPIEPTSLYLHVPYCRALCHYCGCTTKVVRREAVLLDYRAALIAEIGHVGRHLSRRPAVSRIHWGGGTPTFLGLEGLDDVLDALGRHFDVRSGIEHAIELDPRYVTPALARGLAELGVNRVSLGVQDLDPDVQAAIGRVQPRAVVRRAVDALRGAGIVRINFDLIYGLPLQTVGSVTATAEGVLELAPDRVACYGYAHLPGRMRNQRLIDEAALPDAASRHAQATAFATALTAGGLRRVGMDHFARADDPLAVAARSGRLRRNFQGYTDDAAGTLMGFGASAISRFDEGFVQNVADPTAYVRMVWRNVLPTARGLRLSDDDRLRAALIERVMCDFAVNLREFPPEAGFADEMALLRPLLADGLVTLTDDVLQVTEAGRPFVRVVAAVFDVFGRDGPERSGAAAV